MRAISGTAEYQVFGWFAKPKIAAFLIPVTLANLTTLVILAKAMSVGNGLLLRFDPTDPESLVYFSDQTGELPKQIVLDRRDREPGDAKVLFGDKENVVRLWVKDTVSFFKYGG